MEETASVLEQGILWGESERQCYVVSGYVLYFNKYLPQKIGECFYCVFLVSLIDKLSFYHWLGKAQEKVQYFELFHKDFDMLVLFLPSSQTSFCTLEALFFLFVCLFSFVLVLSEWRDGNVSLAVCIHVSRTFRDLVIPVSLPCSVLDVLTFRWVTKCLFFFSWLLDWFLYVKFISNTRSEYTRLPSICLAYWTESD